MYWEADSSCTVFYSLILPLKLGVEAPKMTLDLSPNCIQLIFALWSTDFQQSVHPFLCHTSVPRVMLPGNTQLLQPGPSFLSITQVKAQNNCCTRTTYTDETSPSRASTVWLGWKIAWAIALQKCFSCAI